MFRYALVPLALSFLFGIRAEAAVIEIRFEGIITTLGDKADEDFPGVALGDPIEAVLRYDTNQVPTGNGKFEDYFFRAQLLTESPPFLYLPFAQPLSVDPGLLEIFPNTADNRAAFTLIAPGIIGTALPLASELTSFSSGSFRFSGFNDDLLGTVTGIAVSQVPGVPEPFTATLLVIGGVAIFARRQRLRR